MRWQIPQSIAREAWRLAEKQHWVITRAQLLELGFPHRAIDGRIASGRLHPVHRGVYAVGRPHLTREGELMAGVLACPEGAALSHVSAGELWQILRRQAGDIELSLTGKSVERPGLKVHRRSALKATRHQGIAVTTPIQAIIDIAPGLSDAELETAINQADYHGLTTPERIWSALDDFAGQPGVRPVRDLLERHAYVVTDTELERLMVPIARRAGLPPPLTQVHVNGVRVDFYWPDLGLVVEADGARAHRNAFKQTSDRRREHAHLLAGLTVVRFTRVQVKFEPRYVEDVLRGVVEQLAA
jgi:very-short-patch-repair endonuclease